ncbi:hypothetical protein OIDMADRAFT_44348 [Oidiodendron maius Zn]|uniref:UBC core domain-containing protein n=1 Tax=Oidiodendron maius (strain Zn) TaxID=913774 RepID=A0A0C3D4A8_OIDMZ|nr:hypothetical protein OIDMADRAFT_44348 [Oidiodendron maius Zn]
MSGAAEGIAGLALSAVSVAALFTTCIECFDIVVAGKNFSEDYEQLFALFSVQRARFGLWGESVGFVPNPNDGRRLQYKKSLDRPDIRPGVERILHNIRSLLDEAGRVDDRYGLKAEISRGSEVSTSRGMTLFKGSFDLFKSQLRKHQRQTSTWNVTRWAIHDAKKFEDMINRLKDFVDGLESITKSLGLLEEQHARLREEIDTISDVKSLRLLRDASSSHSSMQQDVSDTARTAESFVTAETMQSTEIESVLSDELYLPGAWPKSLKSSLKDHRRHGPPQQRQPRSASKPSPTCQGCLEEHYKCIPDTKKGSCNRCIQTERECSFLRHIQDQAEEETAAYLIDKLNLGIASEALTGPEGLPQNQRLLSGLIENATSPKPLSFAAGDAHFWEQLTTIKQEDENYWLSHSGKILGNANSGSSAAKRMFIELRNIRAGNVPFISAVPLDDSLARVLASIEGPPETPYEGGVFWITVKLSETNPWNGPPMMRFQTKIYHPNISPQGYICADYGEKWNSVLSTSSVKRPVKDPAALWCRERSTEIQWSLGALLTALCGLLATPDVNDPLVPEIAQKYFEDYNGYCENARLYTRKFATGQRPAENELTFLDESPHSDDEVDSEI